MAKQIVFITRQGVYLLAHTLANAHATVQFQPPMPAHWVSADDARLTICLAFLPHTITEDPASTIWVWGETAGPDNHRVLWQREPVAEDTPGWPEYKVLKDEWAEAVTQRRAETEAQNDY